MKRKKKKKILKRTPSRHQKKKNTTPKKRETIEVWIVFVQFFSEVFFTAVQNTINLAKFNARIFGQIFTKESRPA